MLFDKDTDNDGDTIERCWREVYVKELKKGMAQYMVYVPDENFHPDVNRSYPVMTPSESVSLNRTGGLCARGSSLSVFLCS